MAIYRGVGGPNEATDLATNQAVVAKSYAEQAAQSATEVEQVYNEFLDIYLGDFAANPSTDNQGEPLQVGALYFNSSDKLLRVYDGSTWLVSAVSEPSSFARNVFSGDGSTTAFVLSTTPVNNDSVFAFISGVLTTDYNVVGMTLTFGTAPAIGSDNVLAIVASTVSTLAPADNSVSTVKLQDGAVTTPKIGDSQVTTVKVADANITLAKLASNSVDASKIVSNSVTTSKILDANVTSAKLADVVSGDSVGSATQIPVITYNNKGQITSATTTTVTTTLLETSSSDPTYSSVSSTKAVTPQWAQGYSLRTLRTTDSSPYTPTGAENLARPHGQSVVPSMSTLVLECVIADLGYSIGERVIPHGQWNGSTVNPLPTTYQDTTTCGLKCFAGNVVYLVNKTTGAAASPTASRWKYFFVFTV